MPRGSSGFVPACPRSNSSHSRSNGHILAACHHTICEFKMGRLSRWNIVREAGGSMLTLDFLARQLLQALVMRLRFRTGASDMAAVSEVGEAGRVGYLCE